MTALVRGPMAAATRVGIDRCRVFVAVDQDRGCPEPEHGQHRSEEGVGRHDHFVALGDAERLERELDRGRTGSHADAVSDLAVRRRTLSSKRVSSSPRMYWVDAIASSTAASISSRIDRY